MKRLLLKFWPILAIFLIWFAFSNSCFLKGKVPYASTYQVNFFAPWSHYEKFWGPIKNNAMPDVHTQIYPWKKFTIEILKNWQIALWNPYSFSGNPHLANFQSAVLSPFNLLFATFPFIDAWSISILLQPLPASFFMYLLMRSFKVSQVGSLISSICFMFCGFMVVWMAYGTLGFAILYLPLSLFAIEKYYETNRTRFLILLSLTIPLSFFSGHFQISIYFLTALLSYVLFKYLTTKNILNTLHLILYTLLGLFLSLPQILPSIEFYQYSVRREIFFLSEVIPFNYLITIISPDFFGNPVTRNDWFGHYAEWAGFIGIWPFVLAIFALLKKSSKVFFFAVLGIISLILSSYTPLLTFLVSLKIPVISTSSSSRIIVLFSFSFAVLAGFGLDRLREDLKNRKLSKKITMVSVLVSILIIIVWLLLLFIKPFPQQWLIVAKRNFILPTVLFSSGLLFVIISLKLKKFVILATLYLLLATSLDSFRFAQKWMPFENKDLVYPSVLVIEAMKSNLGDGRVFGNLGAEVSVYYGIPSLEGYDPLYIRRYGEFISSACNGEFLKPQRSVVHLCRNGKFTERVLDILGVSLIFHPIADTNQAWAFPVWKDREHFSLIYNDDKFQLFKNNTQLPRASLFYGYEVVKTDEQIIKRFYSEDFDFRKKLILEQEVEGDVKAGTGSANIVEYSPNKVSIQVKTNNQALLFLSDNFYPGWKAKIDSSPPAGGSGQVETKIYRADYSFRAILVPSGTHKVDFIYEPFSFKIGLWFAGGALLFLAIGNLLRMAKQSKN